MEKHTFEITETIEVTFPHFRRYEFFFFKVLSPEKEICIKYLDKGYGQLATIEFRDIVKLSTFTQGSYEITEEEFEETFLRAIQIINNHKNN